MSSVTVGEIQAGIEITREQDAEKAEELEIWLGKVLTSYNVLPMDATVFTVGHTDRGCHDSCDCLDAQTDDCDQKRERFHPTWSEDRESFRKAARKSRT